LANTSVTAAKISGTLPPSVITGTAAILGANNGAAGFTGNQTFLTPDGGTAAYAAVFGADANPAGTGGGYGVFGYSHSGVAVAGSSSSGTGVNGTSDYGAALRGDSYSGWGVYGSSTHGGGIGGYFTGPPSSGWAGVFQGNVSVTGTLSKGGGSFKIDHPLDPEHKYLYHSFVESPDMKNIYDGLAQLDANGEAWVTLPDWFSVLNRDFRYQLTSIGAFMPVYIAEEVSGNQFKIAGGLPGKRVSWQVTGIRQDAFANAHRIPVEETKPPDEQGTYLHAEEFGQPRSMGLGARMHEEMERRHSAERAIPGSSPASR
jgi:hypothetical protein